MNRLAKLILAVALLAIAGPLSADTVHLQDGRTIRGKIISQPDAPVVKIDTAMGVLEFQASMVRQIKLGDEAPPGSTTPAAKTRPDESAPPAGAGRIDPAVLARFADTRKAAERAATGAEGLAAWDAFLKDCPAGPLTDQARQQRTVWQDRADKNLARFGPNWLPADQVLARKAKAEALFIQADSAASLEESVRLLEQAAQQNPYRADIPMKKAMLYYKAERQKEYGLALGEVLKIEPDNVSARNNLGVLAALQKQWGLAIMNIGRAALASDNEAFLDNLDQVLALAAEAGVPASVLGECERVIRQVLAQHHAAGRHKGETRWGNQWLKDAEFQKLIRENADIDRLFAAGRARLDALRTPYARLQEKKRQLEETRRSATDLRVTVEGQTATITRDDATLAYVDGELKKVDVDMKAIEAEAKKIQDELKKADGKRHSPAHAGKLVLVQPDGKGELAALPVGAPAADPKAPAAPDPKKPGPAAKPDPKAPVPPPAGDGRIFVPPARSD